MMLIDSHIHLDDSRFDDDRDEVVKRASQSGIISMIVPATTADRWQKTKQVTDQYPNVYPAYGLHPYFIEQHKVEHLGLLRDWIKTEQPIAVGECGLDFFLPELDQAKQRLFFEQQLAIAKEFDLPIILHARGAVEDVINTIKKSGHNKGMLHSYNGSLQQAKKLIDMGYLLSFGGAVTFPRANKLRALVKELPLDSLLLETDAPDQSGINRKNERNEPEFITDVFTTVVELRAETSELIATQTTQNCQKLFQLKSRI